MTDVQLLSAQTSTTIKTLEDMAKSSLQYKVLKNYPRVSKHWVRVDPQVAIATAWLSSECTFNIPDYGKVSALMLECTHTHGSDDKAGDSVVIGTELFSRIELTAHNKLIFRVEHQYLKARLNNDSHEEHIYKNICYNPSASMASGAQKFFVDIPSSFFDHVTLNPDFNFLENCQLRCTTPSSVFANAVTASTCYLWVQYWILENTAWNELRASENKLERPLVYLITNEYTETADVTSGVSSTAITLNNKQCTMATHIVLASTATPFTPVAISAVKFEATGVVIYNDVPTRVLQRDAFKYGGSNQLLSVTGDHVAILPESQPITLYWGLEKSRIYNSGALAMANVSNPRVTCTHTLVGNSTTRLYVVSEYWQFVEIDPRNGVIQVSNGT
jgi:hypothetical protein